MSACRNQLSWAVLAQEAQGAPTLWARLLGSLPAQAGLTTFLQSALVAASFLEQEGVPLSLTDLPDTCRAVGVGSQLPHSLCSSALLSQASPVGS